MSKITLDNLSEALKEYIEGAGGLETITSDDVMVYDKGVITGDLTTILANTWEWITDNQNWLQTVQNKADTIGDLSFLETSVKTDLVAAINELANATPDIPEIEIPDVSFDTFSSVDKDTEACSSAGTLTTDLLASKGQAYSLTTTTTSRNIFSARFTDVKFGKYALCIRARVSANTSGSAILTASVLNGSTNILSKNILGTNFDSNSKYCYICTTFDYEGSSSTAKQPLTFSLYSTTVSGITVYFDYAYITLITPAIYI